MPPDDEVIARTVRFGSLTIAYDDEVLAPRSWTELQSWWAVELAVHAPVGPMLELCAGAGQIGLLAVALSDRNLVAVDLSSRACDFARRNAEAAGLGHRVEVRNQPLESACAVGETFPLIIADPPWVPTAETPRFPEDPLSAIDGGLDGLDVARSCLLVIADHLDAGGKALLQVGTIEQADRLRDDLPPTLQMTEVRFEESRGVVALIVRAT